VAHCPSILIRFSSEFQVPVALRKIFPICCEDISDMDVFSIRSKLSQLTPTVSCNAVLQLFAEAGIALSVDAVQFIKTSTVKGVVDGIMGFHGLKDIVSTCVKDVVNEGTARIMGVISRSNETAV
jgi:hypothetical protein